MSDAREQTFEYRPAICPPHDYRPVGTVRGRKRKWIIADVLIVEAPACVCSRCGDLVHSKVTI